MEHNISFSIKGIEIVHSLITAPPEGGKVSRFNFDMQFRAVAAPQENLVTVFSDVVIKDAERNLQIGQYAALFHYNVDALEKWVTGQQNELPKPLLTTLLGISVSTLRGMMFEAYRGTFLHAAVLPIVDVGTLQGIDQP